MKRPIQLTDTWDNMNAIVCSHCGSEFLHHYEVEVYNRTTEDSEEGTYISVKGAKTTVKSNSYEMMENPSRRRDGVAITFECENCRELTEVVLIQHKGQSFIYQK